MNPYSIAFSSSASGISEAASSISIYVSIIFSIVLSISSRTVFIPSSFPSQRNESHTLYLGIQSLRFSSLISSVARLFMVYAIFESEEATEIPAFLGIRSYSNPLFSSILPLFTVLCVPFSSLYRTL